MSRQVISIPIDGLFFLLKDIRQNQLNPLTFNKEWQKDVLGEFFKSCVIEGIAEWKLDGSEIVLGDSPDAGPSSSEPKPS